MSIKFFYIFTSIVFLAGWSSIFFYRSYLKIVQGVVLILLSQANMLILFSRTLGEHSGLYFGYLALVIINLFFIVMIKLLAGYVDTSEVRLEDLGEA